MGALYNLKSNTLQIHFSSNRFVKFLIEGAQSYTPHAFFYRSVSKFRQKKACIFKGYTVKKILFQKINKF